MDGAAIHHDWKLVEAGEFAGWYNWPSDNWEQHGGPFYFRKDEAGAMRCAFRAEAKHMNGQGHMHGGAMMTFADFALFGICAEEIGNGSAVTVSLNSDFISGAEVGDLMEATGRIVRAGKRLIFANGEISTGGRPVLTFTAVLMRVG